MSNQNELIKIKINNQTYEITLDRIQEFSEFQIELGILKAQRNERKRKILNLIKKDRLLIQECMDVAMDKIDEVISRLPEIDYSNRGMFGTSGSPFKVIN